MTARLNGFEHEVSPLIDLGALEESLDAGYSGYFKGDYEPKAVPLPELSPDVRDFLTTEIYDLIANNEPRVERAGKYYAVVSKFEPYLFNDTGRDAVIKFWGHRDVRGKKPIHGPHFKVTYHELYGFHSSGPNYSRQALMTILFRDPRFDVVAFRRREDRPTEDFSITDDLALQLSAEILSTGLLPEGYRLAA